MSIENETFEISHVEWRTQAPREIAGDRNPRKPILVRVDSMSIRCKKCETKWVSNQGNANGQFTDLLGFVRITCPGCGTESAIPRQILNQLIR